MKKTDTTWIELVRELQAWHKEREIELSDTHYGHLASFIQRKIQQREREIKQLIADEVVGLERRRKGTAGDLIIGVYNQAISDCLKALEDI